MRHLSDRRRRVIIASICAVLLIVLFGLVFYGYRKEKARNETLTSLQTEAAELESQIEDINTKIQQLELQATNADVANVNIAFYVEKKDNFDIIKSMEEEYDFSASVIIDVTNENKSALISEAKDNDCEVILTAPYTDNQYNTELEETKEQLLQTDSGCYYMRSSKETDSTIQSMKDVGFDAVIRYSDYVENKRYDNGLVTLGYVAVDADGVDINSRLSAYITNKQSVVIVINMYNYQSGLSKSGLEEFFTTLNETQEAGDIKLNIPSSIVTTINNIIDVDEQSNNDKEAYEEELISQKEELQKQVDAIYAKWNKE